MKILFRFKSLISSGFLKNITILSGGSGLAQTIGILISPLLSRLYSPSDFGVVGSLLAITGVVSLVGSLKYDLAIVLEKNKIDSKSLIDLNVIIISFISLFSAIALFVSPYLFSGLNEQTELVNLFPYAIPIIFFSALYNVYTARLNRDKEYKKMAILQITRKLSTNLIQLFLGIFSASALGLVLGNVFGVIIPLLFLVFIKNKSFSLYNYSSFKSIKDISKKYLKFPFYIAPQSFMNLVSGQLPIFVLGYYFNLNVAGAYFFTIKIVQVPAMFIGSSFRQVFYQEVSYLKEKIKDVFNLYIKTTSILFFIILIPALIIFLFGEDMFIFIFGNQWSLAGKFASYMFLWYGSNVITGPARSLFLVYEKQKMVFYIDLILLGLRLSALLFLSINFDSIVVIKWFSIISVIFNLFVIIWWLYFFNNSKLSI